LVIPATTARSESTFARRLASESAASG